VELPALALPASASLVAADARVSSWDLSPLRQALQAGLLPVIFGDVVFDLVRGGTIFSTEDLFVHLAGMIRPATILLAGIEDGVWLDFPDRTRLASRITPNTLAAAASGLRQAVSTDVTGGMSSKVLNGAAGGKLPHLKVLIFLVLSLAVSGGHYPANVWVRSSRQIRR
jgi:isopentenyl phosphate kinase